MLRILGFLALTIAIPCAEPLKCYQCIIFECPTLQQQEHTAAVCGSMISFVQESLVKYYPHVRDMTICPPHTELSQWMDLQLTYPSNIGCPIAYEPKHAYCALGRIKVVTTISALNSPFTDGSVGATDFNVTSHATVLGCATKSLLRDIAQFKPEKTKEMNWNLKDTCPFWNFDSSPVRNTQIQVQLRHAMQLEQCDQLSDLCTIDYGATLKHPTEFDYCIQPHLSKVKPFDPMGGNYNANTGFSFLGIVLIIALCIGLVVGVTSFAGVYCENR